MSCISRKIHLQGFTGLHDTHTHTCTPKGKPIHRLNRYQQMCFGPMSKEKTSEIKTQIRFLEIGSMRVMTRRGWWERARWKLGREGSWHQGMRVMIIYMAPAAHLALTYPSVHLAVTELGPLLGLGSREPALQPWPHMHSLGGRDTSPWAALTENGECCDGGYTLPSGRCQGNLNTEQVGVGRMKQMAMEANSDHRTAHADILG